MKLLELIWHKTLNRPHRLAVRIDEGNGEPVIFLHGLAARAEDWQPAIDRLDDRKYRKVAIDLLGFGTSPRPDYRRYTADDQARSVLYTMKKLGIKKPCVVVGHSMGAVVAARITAYNPKAVKHQILYEIPVYSDFPDPKLGDPRNRAYVTLFKRIVHNPKLTTKSVYFVGKIASRFLTIDIDGDGWLPFERSLMNTVVDSSVYDDLTSVSVRTDVVYGKYDLLVITKTMKKLFKNAPHVRFHQVNEVHRISKRTGEKLLVLLEKS